MSRRLSHLLRNATFCLAFLIPFTASASPSKSFNQSGSVALVAAIQSVGDQASLQAGLAFDLKPGWKIYWRFPGDAGYPPKTKWADSSNIGQPLQSWPAPHRTVDAGLQTIGYTGSIILPFAIPISVPGQAVHLHAAVDYLACEKICVPLDATLDLDIPAGPAKPSEFFHPLAQALAAVPVAGDTLGWGLDSVESVGSSLIVILSSAQGFSHPDVLIEDEAGTSYPVPVIEHKGAQTLFTYADAPADLIGRTLTLTVLDSVKAGTFTRAVTAGKPRSGASIWLMAAIALLGGLILNLMPCVLPILSLKILSLLAHSGGHRLHARAGFLASSAGILVSFLGLAALLIAIRGAGHAVGWGLQFQQPLFLAFMIAVLTLFAANLWGAFEIPLPSWAGELGTGGTSLAGHFLSGMFATLLATPCSAPFVGTAISFALSRGPSEIIIIFLALGTGMSAPFLTVALWPELATRLPHPGPWMGLVRKLLGVILAVTALWLGAVLFGVMGHASAAKSESGVAWTAFDQSAIAAEVAKGHVVLVDVTADWCITCKVNKLTVIERGDVAQALSQPGLVAMQADWTKPDDAIAHYLETFGRFGIPFNAVYGPAAPNGIALPELLTNQDVLSALHAAKP